MFKITKGNALTKKAVALSAAVVLVGVGAALAVTSPASATGGDRGQVSVTVKWLMPEGGTPTNVTYPQTLYPEPTCGTGTIQVDQYTGTKEQIDAVLADSMLEEGEDDAIPTKAWFETQTPCAPKPTTVTALPPTFVDSCETANDRFTVPTDVPHVTYMQDDKRVNGAGVVTISASVDADYVLDSGKASQSWTHEFTNEQCVNTPTPTATSYVPTTPSNGGTGVVTTVPKDVTPAAAATPTGELAFTGSEGLLTGWIVGGILLLAGLGLMIARSIRKTRATS